MLVTVEPEAQQRKCAHLAKPLSVLGWTERLRRPAPGGASAQGITPGSHSVLISVFPMTAGVERSGEKDAAVAGRQGPGGQAPLDFAA